MPDPSLLPNPRSRNPEFLHFPKTLPHDNVIHRGYMRLLHKTFSDASEEMGEGEFNTNKLMAKLNFQFNPNQLTRSVTARTDTQLWINQSPTQLLQPAIGDMTFGWTMLFNREAEVSSNVLTGESRTQEWSDPFLDALVNPSDGRVYNPEMVVQRLGVLADIALLDRITGQSITQEAVNYARTRHDVVAETDLNEEAEVISNNFVIQISERNDDIDIISDNVHNAAFLIPNPVRAVFSENFMVDGYVNSVTVSFQKFSPEMIPTVAVVDVSMHAIYQGFARQKSIFTSLLKLASQDTGVNSEGGNPLGEHGDKQPIPGTTAGDIWEESEKEPKILTGIQHGKDIPDEGESKRFSLARDTDTFSLKNIIRVGPADDGGNTFEFQHGFKYRPYTSFDIDSTTGLAQFLHSKKGVDDTYINGLFGKTHLGLSIRARLKAADKADLEQLVNGSSDGMNSEATHAANTATAFKHEDAFFVGWSHGKRMNLFGIGLDNLGTDNEDEAQSEFEHAANLYTHAFPIIELPHKQEGVYGDNLGDNDEGTGVFVGEFPSIRIQDHRSTPTQRIGAQHLQDTSPIGTRLEVVGTDSTWGDAASPAQIVLASGFHGDNWFNTVGSDEAASEGTTVHGDPFPTTIILRQRNNAHTQFDVEYQIRILFNHLLWWGDHEEGRDEISESGWHQVSPVSATDFDLAGGVAVRSAFPRLDGDYPWLDNPAIGLVFTGDLPYGRPHMVYAARTGPGSLSQGQVVAEPTVVKHAGVWKWIGKGAKQKEGY